MKDFSDATVAALVITLLILALVMRENKRLRQGYERLEGANDVLQDALIARTQQVRRTGVGAYCSGADKRAAVVEGWP